MRKLLTVLMICAYPFVSLSQTKEKAVNTLYGKWKYVEATLIEPNQSKLTVVIDGDFNLFHNGTYEMARYIGGVGAFPKGKYILKGKLITLYNSGMITDTVIYSWGTYKDRHGNSLNALMLKSKSDNGTITVYTLTR